MSKSASARFGALFGCFLIICGIAGCQYCDQPTHDSSGGFGVCGDMDGDGVGVVYPLSLIFRPRPAVPCQDAIDCDDQDPHHTRNCQGGPAFVSVAPTAVDEGAVYSYDVVCSNGEVAPVLTLALGAGDDCGGTLTDNGDGTGNYSFPTDESDGPGQCALELVCADASPGGVLTATQAATVTINELNQPPAFTSAVPADLAIDETAETFSHDPAWADPDLPDANPGDPGALTCAITANSCGPWLVFTGCDAAGTPGEADAPGACAYTLTVTDGYGLSAIQTVSLVLNELDQPPVFSSAVPADTSLDEVIESFAYAPTFTDPDLPAAAPADPGFVSCAVTANSCGAWLSFTGCAAAGAPGEADAPGACSYTITVTDGYGLSATQTVSLTLNELNQPPVITSTPPADTTLDEGEFFFYDVYWSDPDAPWAPPTDPGHASCAITANSCGPWLTIDPPCDVFGQPGETDAPGSCSYTITVTDGWGATASQTIAFTLNEVNQAPYFTAAPTTIVGAPGAAYSAVNGVLADDDRPAAAPGDPGFLTCAVNNLDCSFAVSVTTIRPSPGEAECQLSFTAPAESELCSILVGATDGYGLGVETLVRVKVGCFYLVNDDAGGAGDGSSWADAFTKVQPALDAAAAAADPACEVWVAEGTYYRPTSRAPGNLEPVVTMAADVDLYGGFMGTETRRAARPATPLDYPSALDGETESAHVVVAADLARFDGFVVTGGFAASTAFPPAMLADPGAFGPEYGFFGNMGGGMLAENISALAIDNSFFHHNYAGCFLYDGDTPRAIIASGSALFGYSVGDLALRNTRFEQNSSGCGLDFYGAGWNDTAKVAPWGGAIGLMGVSASILLEGCSVVGNSAAVRYHYSIPDHPYGLGGGILIFPWPSSPGSIFLIRSDFRANFTGADASAGDTAFRFVDLMAAGGGGAIFGDSVEIADCSFSANTSGIGAGLFLSADLGARVSGSRFLGNVYGAAGGGLEFQSSSPAPDALGVDQCAFENNVPLRLGTGFIWGGGLHLDGGFRISNSTFTGNQADHGGGVYANLLHPSSLDATVFTGNHAAIDGGGVGVEVFAAPLPFDLQDCDFIGNRAGQNGGAISTSNQVGTVGAAILQVLGGRFVDNVGGVAGGAIDARHLGKLFVAAATFTGNQAQTGDGGAVSAQAGSSIDVSFSTFSGNRADLGQGGALALAAPAADLFNVLIVGNSSGGSGAAFSFKNGDLLVQNATIDNNYSGTFYDAYLENYKLTLTDSIATGDEWRCYCAGACALNWRYTDQPSSFVLTGPGATAITMGPGVFNPDPRFADDPYLTDVWTSPTLTYPFYQTTITNTVPLFVGSLAGMFLQPSSALPLLYPIAGSINDTVTVWGQNFFAGDGDVFSIFDYHLSHLAAGQAVNSPCINTGSATAAALGLSGGATRTDGVLDAGTVDLGYHFPWP